MWGEVMKNELKKVQNALIDKAELIIENGALTFHLTLRLENGFTQCFGGHSLYLPDSFSNHSKETIAGHCIFELMRLSGVSCWSELKGKSIRVEGTHKEILAIGHIIEDIWLCINEESLSAGRW